MKINKLTFQPLRGLASKHLQMLFAFCIPPGSAPPSKNWLIELEEGDRLSCKVSTPSGWKEEDRTVALIHGMGGCHSSRYMVRLAQKLYLKGIRAVRINLRGSGSGQGLSKLPYNGGNSGDVLKVLEALKRDAPSSDITLVGFSLGGNIVLKLAGELGRDAEKWVKTFIAVCPPLDLAQSVRCLEEKRNRLYHFYYVQQICRQARPWSPRNIRTLYEFDNAITAPLWGYKGASEYYQNCSSIRFLPQIEQSTHLLFAEDDPFVSLEGLQQLTLPDAVQIWMTEQGGHMGFLGKVPNSYSPYWMDHLLLNWIDGNFSV